MGGAPYTQHEEDIIREFYPLEGLPGAMVQLQKAGYKRTANSVRNRAFHLKLRSPYYYPAQLIETPPAYRRWSTRQEELCTKTMEIVAQGKTVAAACRETGMERTTFYRIRKARNDD